MSEESTDRQRAADRVSAFLNAHGSIDDNSSREEICRVNHETLFTADLRLLVQAAPALPPKWSGLLADPVVHVVIDGDGVVLLATRDEQRAMKTAEESDASVTSMALEK